MNDNNNLNNTCEEIMEFLRQLQWPAEVLSSKVVKTYYQGDFGISEVRIYINSHELSLIIDPVVQKQNEHWGQAVHKLVFAMAREIHHIGVGIDGDGDLFVKVNLPKAHVNLERFHCVLLGLCQVAENMLLPILQANAFDHLEA